MTPLVAVIVNYEKRELLRACLHSLGHAAARAGIAHEVVVVDNGSGDGSVEMVKALFPEVRVLALPTNRGFPAGVNAGLAATRSEWVLLLNNDTTLSEDALHHLLGVTNDPSVGAVAAQMRFADREGVINSAGIDVDVLGVAFDRLLGAPTGPSIGEPPYEVFGASAGAALYRRRALEEVGGFDASYFVFLEDVDLAWRARMAGWRAMYVPEAVVWHHHSATARHGSRFKYFHVGRNRVRLIARNAHSQQLRRHGLEMLVYDFAYIVFVAAKDRTLAPLRGRLAGLRDWHRYRRLGAKDRRPLTLAPRRGLRAALLRRSAWAQPR